jgi:putative ABC transport system permease protein
VGDPVAVELIDGTDRELTVQGTYTENALAGSFVITQGLSEASGTDQFDFTVYVRLAPGVSLAAGEAALRPVVDGFPNAEMLDRQQYVDDQAETIDGFVNFIYGMLAFAVLIALFGIANTLLLSVHERTRELGLLRAVGMSRRQMRSTVRLESVIIALLGVAMGLVLAVFLGFAFVRALHDDGIETFKFPTVPIVVIVVLAVLFALWAARRPAKRAAKLDILRAIAHD